ncbi:MAG: hypothetical protein OXE99_04305 [Cellvibrionales bacterium]|nr:hypothetical protein [Cellvibrionales bacterium]
MPLKKLQDTAYRLIEDNPQVSIYHPADVDVTCKTLIIFCRAEINSDSRGEPVPLAADMPAFSYLAPEGYELFAVKGHFSDYQLSEKFDPCKPLGAYYDHKISPPLTEIFTTEGDKPSLLTIHKDFDILVLKQSLELSTFLQTTESLKDYQQLLLHCSRCLQGKLNIKYFLPVEQHAHILAQNKPLDWQSF